MQFDRFFGKLCFFSIHVSAIGLLLLVKNCAYYIRIFTVIVNLHSCHLKCLSDVVTLCVQGNVSGGVLNVAHVTVRIVTFSAVVLYVFIPHWTARLALATSDIDEMFCSFCHCCSCVRPFVFICTHAGREATISGVNWSHFLGMGSPGAFGPTFSENWLS